MVKTILPMGGHRQGLSSKLALSLSINSGHFPSDATDDLVDQFFPERLVNGPEPNKKR